MRVQRLLTLACALLAMWAAPGFAAGFENGGTAPVIIATDINGNEVNINELIKQQPYVVIVHFFSVTSGEEVALKLRYLHLNYGKDKVKIISLGMKEDEAALKKFAEALDIDYFIIDSEKIKDKDWLQSVDVLPLTLFVHPSPELLIERAIKGGGEARARVLKEFAETLFRKNLDPAMAVEVLDEAAKDPEGATEAKELKGYVLAGEGKLDEAEKEFAAIDSKAGLATVAKDRGEYDKAIELADQSKDPHAATVKAEALMQQGDAAKAAEVLSTAEKPAEDWKQSDALNAQGRANQQLGKVDEAVSSYQNAVAIDPLNVVALSNEGAAQRSKGDPESLQKAQEALEKAASRTANDQLVTAMLQQVQKELKRANDVESMKLTQQMIKDLGARFKEMQADPSKAPADSWSSRPMVMAFLPSSEASPVFFERAGTDVVLQRELEARIQADGRMTVVERQMLDMLLQELNLGSSELASADTQKRLGQVLSAGVLGFISFGSLGPNKQIYLRAVDTETTRIVFQTSKTVNESQPVDAVEQMTAELLEKLAAARELKGLIAEASADDAIIINLGSKHGVTMGQEFTVLQDGEPITAGGREIAKRQTAVGKIVVTQLEPEYAICKLLTKKEGVTLAKDMKIKSGK